MPIIKKIGVLAFLPGLLMSSLALAEDCIWKTNSYTQEKSYNVNPTNGQDMKLEEIRFWIDDELDCCLVIRNLHLKFAQSGADTIVTASGGRVYGNGRHAWLADHYVPINFFVAGTSPAGTLIAPYASHGKGHDGEDMPSATVTLKNVTVTDISKVAIPKESSHVTLDDDSKESPGLFGGYACK